MEFESIKTNLTPFTTFKELWDAISPPESAKYDLRGFVFRGVSSSKHELLPKVLRKDSDKGDLWIWENKSDIDEYESTQAMREKALLANFYRIANSRGLKIPNAEILKYYDQEEDGIIFPFDWPSKEYEETAALAQHYGIPTRLLDWTKDLFTAFYFASTGAIKKIEKAVNKCKDINLDDYFAIYALNYNELSEQVMFSKEIGKDNRFDFELLPLKFVIPNYSENPNANAQQGLFTYSRRHIEKNNTKQFDAKTVDNILSSLYASNKIDYTPLDKELERLVKMDMKSSLIVTENTVLLYKFELPIREAIPMFDFITFFNYSHVKLFPSYDGVQEEMREIEIINEVRKYIRRGVDYYD